MKVVLFDIDGTLLWTDGAGRRAMEGALRAVFGVTGPATYRYDGKTDMQIVRDTMRLEGFDDAVIDDRMPRTMAEYLARLHGELGTNGHRTHRYDGVLELLDALAGRDDRVSGLLTGNLERGAHAKLRAAGLAPERFTVGAFGSDHEIRSELPAIARQRATVQLGLDVRGEDLVIIGDTPSDIACGRGIGARAIAVATGRYSVSELAEHEPAALFPTLADTVALMQAIDDA